MKKKCFEGLDFYDSEFLGFQYEDSNLQVLIELWKGNHVVLEFEGVKFFSLDSYDVNAIPYLYENLQFIPQALKDQPFSEGMKHFGVEDINNKPFLYVVCSQVHLIEV